MDETIESNDSFPRKILGRGELENRGKQRVAPVKGAVSTKAIRGRRVEEESKREGRRMRENTER